MSARRGSRRARPGLRREQVAGAANFVRRGAALGLGRPPAGGSNWWLVSGARSATGFPLLASDPHLGLPRPPVWHEIGLNVAGNRHDGDRLRAGNRHDAGRNVYGTNLPGVPGLTRPTNPLDVTDFFQERVIVEDGVPVATVYKGVAEPLVTVSARVPGQPLGRGAGRRRGGGCGSCARAAWRCRPRRSSCRASTTGR